MENKPRRGFEATGIALSDVKPFYDAVFPEWEAIQLDPDNPTQGYIQYSATSSVLPLSQVEMSSRGKGGINLGIFVVENLKVACDRVEENGGEVSIPQENDKKALDAEARLIRKRQPDLWCFCEDPVGNSFSIVQLHDAQ